MSRTRRRSAALLSLALLALPGIPGIAHATPNPSSWQADLSTVDNDDVNVRSEGGALTLAEHHPATLGTGTEGYLLLPERTLDRPVNRISAEITANTPDGAAVEVDVRGRTGGDDWTEWLPAGADPALLPQPVTSVQTRLTLHAAAAFPRLDQVRFTADEIPAARTALAAAPRTYRVFGTREGLVGGTTANGHVITARDHFVSFPSGKSLSPKGTGTYTARVCRTDNSRCEYAPVWEKGPWNIKDDYWNPSAERQMWKDLPQGKPEAQAAYQDGYHGGRDDSGRKVGNPAGIDIADGTFWDGLKLTDNAWVNVTYLWTGSGPTGVVTTAGDPLNVRASASTSAAIKGFAANYAQVIVECYVEGDSVTGPLGTSRIWDRIGPGHYISDTYLKTGSNSPVAPKCT
ncbi:hypothetical protein [Amycolatopsis anabasis]|uniref:hypothetical protein n=1 Tax=Amycolatopsis anabasis TaxID=1840409 RepID=UPI00131B6B84|nr:hypothetical protein [Amycolatopsis anabasis]